MTYSPPQFLEKREQFIPFRTEILLERMFRDPRLAAEDHEAMRRLRDMLGNRFHFEYHDRLESLKNDFVPFDPDKETFDDPVVSEDELPIIRKRLYEGIQDVLRIGNYTQLTSEQMTECLELQPVGGLSVHADTSEFDEFHVYYRGVRQESLTKKFAFVFNRTHSTAVLKRVFVIARFKPEFNNGQLIVKIFKDVPVEDIKIVVPKVKLGMPIFDRFKIGGSVLGSLVTPMSKLVFAFTLSWVYFIIILSGLLLAAFKGVMSFLNSKTKYLHVFSSQLYYRNLSNNKAALTSLIDDAEEQEVKEALIGYFILFVHPGGEMSMQELDEAAEDWIRKQFGREIDFEVEDAIRKLAEKELLFTVRRVAVGSEFQEVFRVRNLPDALHQLDEAWDEFYDY